MPAGAVGGADPADDPPATWWQRLLAVPLLTKIAGANTLIVIVASAIALRIHNLAGPGRFLAVVMILSLVISLLVNLVLVVVALQPLRTLEGTAELVSLGNLDARVAPSLVADRDMVRIGGTFNLLLDRLTSDRARMRRLASQVIDAQDQERARIARELHDSTAQSLTALMLQLSATVRDAPDPALAARLDELRGLAGDVLEEVRTLSHTVHPRVLDDLGLVSALEWLARHTRESISIPIEVEADGDLTQVSPPAAAVLYRVAQEALANAVRHASPTMVRLHVRTDGRMATLQVTDDGIGFDLAEAEARRPGMGLFSMQERVALVDGHIELTSAPGAGTRVVASVPLVPLRLL